MPVWHQWWHSLKSIVDFLYLEKKVSCNVVFSVVWKFLLFICSYFFRDGCWKCELFWGFVKTQHVNLWPQSKGNYFQKASQCHIECVQLALYRKTAKKQRKRWSEKRNYIVSFLNIWFNSFFKLFLHYLQKKQCKYSKTAVSITLSKWKLWFRFCLLSFDCSPE